MARAATKSSKNNQPTQQQPPKGKIAVRQESPKGDMFFKVVITILIVGIVAVLIWFLVDSLINRDEEDQRFNIRQFVLLDDIERIYGTVANPQEIFISNEELRDIFNRINPEINMVYILFYNVNFEDEFENGIMREEEYDRFKAAWDKWEELLELGYVVDDEEGSARNGFIYFDSIAVFMLNLFSTGNENWWFFLNDIKDENAPVLPTWGPSLLIIDFNPASPSFYVEFGTLVPDAIQEVIDIVTGVEYQEEEEQDY